MSSSTIKVCIRNPINSTFAALRIATKSHNVRHTLQFRTAVSSLLILHDSVATGLALEAPVDVDVDLDFARSMRRRVYDFERSAALQCALEVNCGVHRRSLL